MEDHSDKFKMMVANRERFGTLEDPDGYGIKRGDCGDIVEMYLEMKEDRVENLYFQIAGCLNTFACANTVSYLAEGRSIQDCWQITPETIIDFLESLPADHQHCAELAVGTFYLTLNNYNRKSEQDSVERVV